METYKEFIKRKDKEFKQKSLIPMKDIGRKGKKFFQREAWTFMPQYNLQEKVFVIERLKKISYEGKLTHPKVFKKGAIEYRIGYYMIGKNGNMKGKWVWGQFCPLIPQQDLNKLLLKAKKEKTIL